MPSAVSPPVAAEPTNYNRDVDDFLRDLPLNNDAPPTTTTTTAPPAADPDAEIKIRKKRAPVLKLDETLLLSPAGIPKLRSHARSSTHLKFKGKGHEFSDMGRLLHMYQLWLDDLYPKAKFRDGLAMVEKVGHGKRMAVVRRGCMDGSKPGRGGEGMERVGGEDGDGDLGMGGGLGAVGGPRDDLSGEGGDAQAGAGQGEDRRGDVEVPAEDELDALMGETANTAPRTKPQQQNRAPFEDDDGPDDDELDALMGHETNATTGSTHQPRMQAPFQDDDEDDEDALDALMAESARPASAPDILGIAHSNKPFQNEDDEDELDALLAEQR
ncbi:chromosome segregation in meiosis-related protein [Friedmanniomyces endolithicus]|nr:chromosome segregation in meiosis-related protein [Friedmanniomyces endolithicus]